MFSEAAVFLSTVPCARCGKRQKKNECETGSPGLVCVISINSLAPFG